MHFSKDISVLEGGFEISFSGSQLIRLGVTNKQSADATAVFLLSWCTLLSDSPLPSGRLKPRHVVRSFIKELSSQHIKDTVLKYTSLANTIMQGCTMMGEGSSTGPFLPEMKNTPVFKEYHFWWRTGDPVSLRYLLSFLMFGKKFKYDDDELHATAFRTWLGVEDSLSMPFDAAVASKLQSILRQAFTGFMLSTDDLVGCRHGPGAVSGPERGYIEKSCNFQYDSRLDRAFVRGNPFLSGSTLGEDSTIASGIIPDIQRWKSDRNLFVGSDATSRLRFVYKTVKTARSMCMEPTPYMFFQQGVRLAIQRQIRDSFYHPFIRLEDQTYNQGLSDFGSSTGEVDTIDLSAASDTVGIDLVRSVFPSKVLYWLLCTRTSSVFLPDGTKMKVRKFAPMGSALCFPVQSLIFASVVLYAYIRYVSNALNIDEDVLLSDCESFVKKYITKSRDYHPSRLKLAEFSAYGDDIICDSRVTHDVLRMLRSLRFVPNEDKSFTASQAFRESCGKFHWNGHDITPLFYSVRPFKHRMNAQSVLSGIAFCNLAGDYSFRTLHSFWIRTLMFCDISGLKKVPQLRGPSKNPIAFSDNRNVSYTIYSKTPVNKHLAQRIDEGRIDPAYRSNPVLSNPLCKRIEYRRLVGEPAKFKSPSDSQMDAFEMHRYHMWWRAAPKRINNFDEAIEIRRGDSSGLRIRTVWTGLD